MKTNCKGELLYIGEDKSKYAKVILIEQGTRCRYCFEELEPKSWGYICAISNEVQCEKPTCKKKICETLHFGDHEDVFGEFKIKGDKL